MNWTDCMGQSPSAEFNRYSASQEFHLIGSLIIAFTRWRHRPYPEPGRSTPYTHNLLPEAPSKYYVPIYAFISQVFFSATKFQTHTKQQAKL